MSLLIAPIEALTDPEITYTEKLVLLALFSFRGKDTNTVWPSIGAIAERALIKDTPRISKITNSLQKKGWLTKKRKGFTGCNQYVLTVPERLSNLEDDTNLVESTNLAKIAKKGESTSSNLAKITKSNLAKIAKYKEQTNEQTIEQTNKNILSDADASNPPVEQNQSDEILNLDSDSTLDNSTGTPTCPSKQIIELYNEILPELPRVMKITDSRTQATRNRWKQDPEHQSLEFWRAFFHHVRKSDFLMGRTQKPFSCSYDWIMKQANFVKIYEGNYHQ